MDTEISLWIVTGLFFLSQIVYGLIIRMHMALHERQMEYLRQRLAAMEKQAND